jgi:hypothetical protein
MAEASGAGLTGEQRLDNAAFDGLRRIAAAGKESLDESAKRLSPNL